MLRTEQRWKENDYSCPEPTLLGPGTWFDAKEHIEDGSRVLAGPEQVVGAMNGDIQAAGKLLTELREAYRSLPQHVQMHVTRLLRESTLQKQSGDKRAS